VTPAENLVDFLATAGNFTTLVDLVTDADLVRTLIGEGPYTLFAPTDEAFEALPPAELQALRDDPQALEDLLNYHVVEGELMADDLVDEGFVTTVEGSNISITEEDGEVMLNNEATITEEDIDAGNGVVHVIDTVVMPPTS
jgi:uncharacterized surface protein with fasciclin (FAS1) repeats